MGVTLDTIMGMFVFSLQYLLGYSTLQMTQRYLQSLNANDAIIANKKFSPLDNLGKGFSYGWH